MGRGLPSPREVGGAFLLFMIAAGPLAAGEPLHRRIDRLVEAKAGGEPAAPATDAEFLRRVCLDLAGMIPTADEARAFLDDPSPYKRDRLIDRLLDGPEYARRMQQWLDVTLMERRDDAHVPGPEWRAFLRRAFAKNVPYNQLVSQILSADGTDPRTRPAAKFTLDRQAEPNLMTRDIGRMFLGRDFQCNQCHDHPLIDDYKQAHYYGIFAFVNRTTLVTVSNVGAVLGEKAEGDVTFTSVFKKKVSHRTGPRILDGTPVDEPAVDKGAEYLLAPDKDGKVPPIPRYSRRAQLGPRLTSGAVPEFNRTIANRLWALMMGRGLVHPLDMDHSENPPTHPELLDLLSREFAAMGFNVKGFLRELALSRTYQQSSEPRPGASPGESDAEGVSLAVASLRPLTPEQMGWSVLQAFGFVAAYRQSAIARLEGEDPRIQAVFQTDAKRQALRASMIEEAVHDGLEGNVIAFVQQFGAAAGQPQDGLDPTVHQALFLSNGPQISSWVSPGGSNLMVRLAAITDPSSLAEELYLTLFSRRPTAEERAEVTRYLSERGKDRGPAIQELTWALLASTEFRFNH